MPDLNPERAFAAVKQRLVFSLSQQFPITGRKHRLELVSIDAADKASADDLDAQLTARVEGRTWSIPIVGVLRLVEISTGKVLDEKKTTLAHLPRITRRYTYIVDGHERQVDGLFRLKPGIYHRVSDSGSIEAQWNLQQGHGFHLWVDKTSKGLLIKMSLKSSNIPIYPILRALGVSDAEMGRAWGPEVADANRAVGRPTELLKIPRTMARTAEEEKIARAMSPEEAAVWVKQFFEKTRTRRPDGSTHNTLGVEMDAVSGAALLASATRLVAMFAGKAEPDDRQSLASKDFAHVEDFVAEAIKNRTQILTRKVKNLLDSRATVREIMPAGLYTKPVDFVFTNGHIPEQHNPLSFVSGHTRTTLLSEAFGGVAGSHVNLDDDKLINETHLGFLDPIQTPEGETTGVTLHLPIGVRKQGMDLVTRAWSTHRNTIVDVTPGMLESSVVAFPDQVTWPEGGTKPPKPIAEAVVVSDHKATRTVAWKQVDYVLLSPKTLFGFSANMVPFLSTVSGNRAMVAAKQQEQAVSLLHREAPLVQAHLTGGTTFDRMVGSLTGHDAPVSGTVTKVDDKQIRIKDSKGAEHIVSLYDHFPLNGGNTMLHSTPLVKVGATVKQGEPVADTNYSKGGHIALGTNLRVSYLPYKGRSFEDGIVISETAAKKLTSEHLYAESVFLFPGMELNKKRWQDYALPSQVTPDRLNKLDNDGMIRKGQNVIHGDILVAVLSPNHPRPEDIEAGRISKHLLRAMTTQHTLFWEHDTPGTVIRVVRTGAKVVVHVRTEEPMTVGDKMTARYGNKGIVSTILPDHKMPKDKDGHPVEVLLNPAGTPGRMNIGQVYETAISKVAKKTGKPYLVENFAPGVDYGAKVQKDLATHKLSDTEELFDADSGRSIGHVLTGHQYFLKLHHQVDHKMTARSYGGGYSADGMAPSGSGIPGGGQKVDQLALYALLAHGADANIREMQTWKSDKEQGEVWLALQKGQPLPPPVPNQTMPRFIAIMRGMGIHMEKKGSTYSLSPLTDHQTLKFSNGEVKQASKTLMARGPRTVEEVKGLFDRTITGGLAGTKWSHITLAQRLPNPIFEEPIQLLTGMTQTEWNKLVSPECPENGFDVIAQKLKAINTDAELKKAEAALPKLRGSPLNKEYRRVRYLRALQHLGISAYEAYTTQHMPVLPPVLRPVKIGMGGDQVLDDMNALYRTVGELNEQLQQADRATGHASLQKLRAGLYTSVEALRIQGADLGENGKDRHHRGMLELMKGTPQPKNSLFQSGLLGRRQDLSARSTIIPAPEMSLNEIGVPLPVAMEVYKPFIVQKLHTELGYTPLDAQKLHKEKDPIAIEAAHRVAAERPVIVKRDPALHMHSTLAFHPRITDGKAIGLHPLVCEGFNADYDGDCYYGQVLVYTEEKVAYHEQMPHHLRVPGQKILHIKDFPRVESTRVEKASGVIEYEVPAGVQVPACVTEGGVPRIENFVVTRFSEHPNCEEWTIRTRAGRELMVSEDHSLALLDPDTLEIIQTPPREALGRCMPTLFRSVSGEPVAYDLMQHRGGARSNRTVGQVEVTASVAWMIGATIGDGWVTQKGATGASLHFSWGAGGREVANEWRRIVHTIADGAMTDVALPHEFEGRECCSYRITLSNATFARWIRPLIGTGAREKHLPPGALFWGVEQRRGLLSGLLDTDGCASVAASGRFACSLTTTSARLTEEVRLLGLTLGLISTVTEYEHRGAPSYLLSFSVRHIQDATWLRFVSPQKQAALDQLRSGPTRRPGHTDFVPLPERARQELLTHLRAMGATARASRRNPAAHSLYMTLKKGLQVLSRESYGILWGVLDAATPFSSYLQKWRGVCDAPVGWDLVEDAGTTGARRTMYDITVPGAWTFATADGAIVWDTMSMFVPVSQEAVQEATKMLPGNVLFSHTTGNLLTLPKQDSLLGIYKVSLWGKPAKTVPPSIQEAIQWVKDGRLPPDAVIHVGGKETTGGRLWLAQSLPAGMQETRLLSDPAMKLDKKTVSDLLTRVAKEFPHDYARVVDAWKDIGNEMAYRLGTTFRVQDFHDGKDLRDEVLSPYRKKEAAIRAGKGTQAEKDEKIVALYTEAIGELEKKGMDHYKGTDNKVFEWVKSGAGKGWGNFGQLVVGPVLVNDAKNRPVPLPITASWGEGLPVNQYWTSLHGARKGTLDRASATKDPGALTKDIINTVINLRIEAEDCGTKRGVFMQVDDRDIQARYTAVPVLAHGKELYPFKTLITQEVVQGLRRADVSSILVRSPLHCELGHGVCAVCYGHSVNNTPHKIGTNIGIISGQALGEPVTQLIMRTFHSGGAVSKGKFEASAFERADQLMKMPKTLPGSAILATQDGVVTRITPNPIGGFDVRIGEKDHYVPADRGKPGVPVGSSVRKGDRLTEGPINPHELLEHTDIQRVRSYLTDEMLSVYRQAAPVQRRNVETVVRGLTNVTRIMEAPPGSAFTRGQHAPLTVVDAYNREAKEEGHPQVHHTPILKPITEVPLTTQEDWMARANYRELKKTFIEGAAQNWSSDIHTSTPAGIAHGAEFGIKPKKVA